MYREPVKHTLLRLDMDTGHYNCRDYVISPHFAPTTLTTDLRLHHESFDELEARSRSPASQKPKFPLLKLPLELRQEILRYLLPCTREHGIWSTTGDHGRHYTTLDKKPYPISRCPLSNKAHFSGANEQSRNYPPRPNSNRQISGIVNNVVWRRGNTKLFSVCQQLHRECAELMYGTNTFLLFVNYATVKFRYRWLLPSGMAPIREYPLLETMPRRYLHLVRHVVINIDHVDAYTGMVKFNVSGKGLAAGLRDRVQSLVDALTSEEESQDATAAADAAEKTHFDRQTDHLSRVTVHVSDQNRAADASKHDMTRQRDEHVRASEDIETILAPLQQLRAVHSARVFGSVSPSLAYFLEDIMMSG